MNIVVKCINKKNIFILKGGTEVMAETEVFVLKDHGGKYVGVNSISYDKEIKEYIYSLSDQLTNGYYTYTNELDAIKDLKLLEDKGLKIKFGTTFHIENIDILETAKNENKDGIKLYPFEHIVIDQSMLASEFICEEGI
jgi:hypothetical protein